ncbi:DUF4931 domain-containing protein [Streptococcus caviae]|uniref:DUF4931 domain-containing protein n=1 Tax=Streptococcus sp. 'caviae' TaxID=1915004 RepID=UPI00094BBEFD|nr:DUF4931 domain-containing protein [Streptococcus sp. 'caviae']OLN84612.1 DUF4931 domain-containing protein [Streptococcus sp. 'caviae']
MTYRKLTFNPNIASQKPSNKDVCPFCDQTELGKILDTKKDMIWVENKFPVLQDSYQTLIIESSWHDGDISAYDLTVNRQLFAFMFEKWAVLEARNDYRSIVLFRNFGPLSGGSLRHPHSQLVGFKDIDAYAALDKKTFAGLEIYKEAKDATEISISSYPLQDFTEFNVRIADISDLDRLADSVQLLSDYVLNDFAGGRCSSYNLFFYRFEQEICCKVVPRFVTSAYNIAYGIHQVNQLKNLETTRDQVRTKFLERFKQS